MDVPFGMQGLFPQPISYPPNPQQPDNEDASQESSDATTSSPQVSVILTVRLLMQGKEVGSIIGRKGDHIKLIRDRSGAKINISDGSCPERIISLTGSIKTINNAFQLISQKFEEDMQSLPNSVPKPPITMRLIIPATQCGSIIGKGGTKIKEIREKTGASIQVASEMLPNSTERAVTISGSCEALVDCMKQICIILQEAPPKGATLPFRPKPTYNPMLIASSAAAAAAAQQQSQQLLNTILQQQSQQQTLLQTMMPYGQATNPLYSMMVQPNVSKAATGYQTISPELQNALLNNFTFANSTLQYPSLSAEDIQSALLGIDPNSSIIPSAWPVGIDTDLLLGASVQSQAGGKVNGQALESLQFNGQASTTQKANGTGRSSTGNSTNNTSSRRFAPY